MEPEGPVLFQEMRPLIAPVAMHAVRVNHELEFLALALEAVNQHQKKNGAVCSGQETGTAADSSTGSSRIGNASAGNAVRTEEEQRRARIMEIYRSFYVQATGQGASAEEARAKTRTDTEAYLMEERRKAGEPV